MIILKNAKVQRKTTAKTILENVEHRYCVEKITANFSADLHRREIIFSKYFEKLPVFDHCLSGK